MFLKLSLNSVVFLSIVVFVSVLFLLSGTAYAANCGGNIACSCGDTLNESRTLDMNDSLTGCPGNGLIINASNVILDCAGQTISGDYSGSSEYGVFIQTEAAGSRINVTVKNCIIYGFNGLFSAGISTYTAYGIPEKYNYTNIINNTIYDNDYGIDAYRGTGNYWLIENNTVTNSSSAGIIINKNDSTVRNNTVETSKYGVFAGYGHNITIIDNFINSTRYITGFGSGIQLSFNGDVYVYNNTVINSENDGITIGSSKIDNVTINGNNIYDNSRYGLNIGRVANNIIWHNNIYNNNKQVYANDAINLSYNNEGNYWGRTSCPTFIAGIDSNMGDVIDYYPYNTSYGWLTTSPSLCGLVIINVTSGSITSSGVTITWTTDRNANSTVNYGTNASLLGSTATNSSYATSHSIPLGGLSESTLYYYNVTSYDQLGNFQTDGTYNFTTSETPTTTTTTTTIPSGGGGGPSKPGPPSKTQIWVMMTPGAAEIMKINDPEIGLKQIIITVRNPVKTIRITVTKLEGQPATVEHNVTGKVYKYIEVEASNLEDENINETKIQFSVNKSWIVRNNINKETIALNRYHNNKWYKLFTKMKSQDDDYIYYEAESPGFSTFVVTGEEILVTTTTTVPVTTTVPTTTTTLPPTIQIGDYTWIIGLVVIVILVIGIVIWKYVL